MRDSGKAEDLAHFRKCNQNKLVIAYLTLKRLGGGVPAVVFRKCTFKREGQTLIFCDF